MTFTQENSKIYTGDVMFSLLMSLGDMPAGEGLGGVISSALLALGTLALIYAVLVILDRYHKKHGGDEVPPEPQEQKPAQRSFPQVLSEQMKKNEDKDKRV